MQLTAREDIAAPIDRVFDAVSDFDGFERAILRRGAEIVRTDTLRRSAPGMSWDTRFVYRGKMRRVQAELTRLDRPEALHLVTASPGLEGSLSVDLVSLSPRETRMEVRLVLTPRSMTARLMVQSMRLAKRSILRKYRRGVRKFARDIETRFGEGQGPGW